MTRKILKRVKDVLVFDFPVQTENVSNQFSATHVGYQRQFPTWSMEATRKIMIDRYWFRQVPLHYAAVLVISMAISAIFSKGWYPAPVPIFFAGTAGFIVVFVFIYWRVFYTGLLTKIDNMLLEQKRAEVQEIAKMHQNAQKQLHDEKLQITQDRTKLEELRQELIKCRKSQLSNFSLVLVIYALDRAENWNFLRCDKQSAFLLTRLFGKDPDDIQKKLAIIYGKKQPLAGRALTELQAHFEDAYSILEQAGRNKAMQVLGTLELKLTGQN
jgi:hypothetical protein